MYILSNLLKATNYMSIQFLGMPHIHGVAWINRKWLQNFGIHGYLTDHPEKTAQLADKIVTCQTSNEALKKTVSEVQIHKHTKSCRKYNCICRYGFARFPSRRTFLTEPLPTDMDLKEKKQILDSAKAIMTKAKNILDDPGIDENMTFDEFLKAIDTKEEDYEKALSTSHKGRVLVLKRSVKERFVNNFNEEMLEAWNANMDIQLAIDPFAVITYIISYVNKDETQITKFLKEALKSTAGKGVDEQLKALKTAYLTNRQIGHSEAVYKLFQGMKLRNSNISCLFVASGFPENRSEFYQKVPDVDTSLQKEFDAEEDPNVEQDGDDDFEEVSDTNEALKIEGKEGKYKKAITVQERYAGRPKCLEKMCLAQFATSYTYASKVPKKIIFQDGRSMEISKKANDNGEMVETNSEMVVFNTDLKMPKYIKLRDKNHGFMRARTFPIVMRIHVSKRKEGHEQYYAELLLFCSWRKETDEFQRWSPEKCQEVYQKRIEELQANKDHIYPGEEVIQLLDSEDADSERPIHIFDMLDSQREQENSDDREVGITDDPAYKSFGVTDQLGKEIHYEDFKYKVVSVPNDDELKFLTERLVPEQMDILNIVVKFCKDVVRFKKNPEVKPEQVKLIVHGGAGKRILFIKEI